MAIKTVDENDIEYIIVDLKLRFHVGGNIEETMSEISDTMEQVNCTCEIEQQQTSFEVEV